MVNEPREVRPGNHYGHAAMSRALRAAQTVRVEITPGVCVRVPFGEALRALDAIVGEAASAPYMPGPVDPPEQVKGWRVRVTRKATYLERNCA